MSSLGKLGQNVPTAMTPGASKTGAGGAGSSGPTNSPFAQGFAGSTASQQGNPNVGGFSTGLGAEVTNPGMGFLSGLLSGAN
jgi:hypothetical protein